MSITYPQKLSILSHFSDVGSWKNLFDMDFFLNARRKWKSASLNNIEFSCDSDAESVCLRHKPTGGSILLKKHSDYISVEDESGCLVKYASHSFDDSVYDGAEVVVAGVDMSPEHSLPVKSMNAIVQFTKSGRKVIRFNDNLSKALLFDAPSPQEKKNKLPLGRLFHAACFNESMLDEFNIPAHDLLNATKLIVSREMDMQKNLQAENSSMCMTPDGSFIEKPWNDVTEFDGFKVDTPFQFFVQTTEDGFEILFSLDDREKILSHTHILGNAISSSITPQKVSADIKEEELLKLLGEGESVMDHRDREWVYSLIKSPMSYKLWDVLRDNMKLSGDHAAAINFGEDRCMVAMDAQILEAKLQP